MRATYYEIRLCQNCGLRYPLTDGHPFGQRCPSCLGETQVALKRELIFSPRPKREGLGSAPGAGVNAALLDNIRSAWNVGAIFRTADGLGINTLYLCGITPTPKNDAVAKISLGAEETMAWEYSRNALETAKKLKTDGHILIALEQDERAISLGANSYSLLQNNILIVGNEVTGVDPEILDICNHIIHIPMRGDKHSFNVEVAFAIAAFTLTNTDSKGLGDL